MGAFELLTRVAIEQHYPAEAARRRQDGEFWYRPSGGESLLDVANRLAAFVVDLQRRHAGQRVLLVAHDAVILMLQYVLEDLRLEALETITAAGPVRNASVTRWSCVGGKLVLAEYNHISYRPSAWPPPSNRGKVDV